MTVKSFYQEVTERIISEISAGTPPWVRPWRDSHVRGIGMLPSNLTTGRLYSGVNILLLWMTAHQRGYSSMQYCTFRQATEEGMRVRKGEKSSTVIFTKRVVAKDEKTEENKPSTVIKLYNVFNLDQLEGVPDKFTHAQAPLDLEVKSRVLQEFIANAGVDVRFGFNQACYIPSQDFIKMPAPGAFKDEDGFAATLMHEVTHWTGSEKRLDRKLSTKFASPEYSFEELIAELGSAFLSARLGYQPQTQAASYLNSWLKVLKADNSAIFRAASYAGQAADWLWKEAFGEEEQQDFKEAAE